MNLDALSISRRHFAQLLGAGAALAAVRPNLSFAKKETLPVTAAGPSAVVRLSSNENPYGPSAKALKAMTDSFGVACRYPDKQNELLIDALARLEGVDAKQILLG